MRPDQYIPSLAETARLRGHFLRPEEQLPANESALLTRMVVEGWVGMAHYPGPPYSAKTCPCLPTFPAFLGPDEIEVHWGGPPPPAICNYHLAGITCEACPQCVRCRRRMSHEHGHWVCDRVTADGTRISAVEEFRARGGHG